MGTWSARGYNGTGEVTVPGGLDSVAQVSAGMFVTCALNDDGTVVCWGSNDFGQAAVSGRTQSRSSKPARRREFLGARHLGAGHLHGEGHVARPDGRHQQLDPGLGRTTVGVTTSSFKSGDLHHRPANHQQHADEQRRSCNLVPDRRWLRSDRPQLQHQHRRHLRHSDRSIDHGQLHGDGPEYGWQHHGFRHRHGGGSAGDPEATAGQATITSGTSRR